MEAAQFVLTKINDVDANCAAAQAELQLFCSSSSKDTILLEVQRQCFEKMTTVADSMQEAFKLLHITDANAAADASQQQIIMSVGMLAADKQNNKATKTTQTDEHTIDVAHNYYVDCQQQQHQQQTDKIIDEEHSFFEQCLEPELDIEEVTLQKCNSNERLGLTVCYSNNNNNNNNNENGLSATTTTNVVALETSGGSVSGSNSNSNNNNSDEDACAEVFISDIQADSIAARDGRLRQGDQILQINGKNVKNKEETETLIAENQNIVTLLVSRYVYADDDDDDFNDDAAAAADMMADFNELVEYMDNVAGEQEEEEDFEEDEFYVDNQMAYENCLIGSGGSSSSSNVKAIFGQRHVTAAEPNSKRIANHIKYEYDQEHIYETIPEDSETEPFYCSPYESSAYITATVASAHAQHAELQQQKQRVEQWLGIKTTNSTAVTVGTTTTTTTAMRSKNNLCQQPQQPQQQTQHRSANTTITSGLSSYARYAGANNTGAASTKTTIMPTANDEQDNSSSAYNTGGSNNSTATPLIGINNMHMLTAAVAPHAAHQHHLMLVENSEDAVQRFGRMQRCLQFTKDNRIATTATAPLSASPKHMMNAALESTNPTPTTTTTTTTVSAINTNQQQQKILKQALNQQQSQTRQQKLQQNHMQQQLGQFMAPNLSQYHFVSSQEVSSSVAGAATEHVENNATTSILMKSKKGTNNDEVAMVWKVKRRQDGTRYIVRRPARNRILRARSTQNNTNRDCIDVTTTEDDTISEIKLGRYWTREERRKHIERARERRLQQQKQQQQQQNMIADKCVINERHQQQNRSYNVPIVEPAMLSKSKTYWRLQRNNLVVNHNGIAGNAVPYLHAHNNSILAAAPSTTTPVTLAVATTTALVDSMHQQQQQQHENATMLPLMLSNNSRAFATTTQDATDDDGSKVFNQHSVIAVTTA